MQLKITKNFINYFYGSNSHVEIKICMSKPYLMLMVARRFFFAYLSYTFQKFLLFLPQIFLLCKDVGLRYLNSIKQNYSSLQK